MTIHKLSRYFALGNFAFAAAVLLSMAVLLNSPTTTLAQTTAASGCVPPTLSSFKITPAYLNSPWSLPLLSNIEGSSTPTVTATGLPPGITLQDQKTVLTAGNTTLHNWILTGAPSQLGTYTINIVAQNSCGGASTIVTLPINNISTAQGSVCPAGTTGTYPNCVSGNTATVAFDPSSLVVSTSSPTITGTSNTAKVSLVVKNNAGQQTYASPSYPVSLGRWAVPISNISTGTYSLSLYGENNLLLLLGTLIAAIPSASGSVSPPTQAASAAPTTLTPVANPAPAAATGSCLQLPAITMQVGGQGSAVSALQNFLIQKGFLQGGLATGYFGPLTRAALGQFQLQQGVVSSPDSGSGFGIVGPRTRAAIAASCGGSSSTSSTQNYTPVTSLPSCPKVPQPICTNGTLVSLGVDENHCSRGSVCQSTQPSRPAGYVCPVVTTPKCDYGDLYPLGTDYYGCDQGYACQKPICYYVPQITSCPAGQTLVSGNDKYGCPNVSYCTGTPTTNPIACLAVAYPTPSCAAGTHVQYNTDAYGCPTAPTCVADGLNCPVASRAACPVGQHYETGNPPTIPSGPPGCVISNLVCVPDSTAGQCPTIPQGFPSCGPGQILQTVTDLNGCPLSYQCGQLVQ